MRNLGRGLVVAVVALMLAGCGGGDQRAELAPLRGLDRSTSTTDGGARADRSTRATDVADSVDVEEVDPKCAVFEEIIRLDDQIDERVTQMLSGVQRAINRGDRAGAEVAAQKALREMQALSGEVVPSIEAAWDRLIEVAPELSDDAGAVRDTTVAVLEAVAGAEPTVEGLNRAIGAIGMDRAAEAGAATYSLDVVSRRDCGLVIAN